MFISEKRLCRGALTMCKGSTDSGSPHHVAVLTNQPPDGRLPCKGLHQSTGSRS